MLDSRSGAKGAGAAGTPAGTSSATVLADAELSARRIDVSDTLAAMSQSTGAGAQVVQAQPPLVQLPNATAMSPARPEGKLVEVLVGAVVLMFSGMQGVIWLTVRSMEEAHHSARREQQADLAKANQELRNAIHAVEKTHVEFSTRLQVQVNELSNSKKRR